MKLLAVLLAYYPQRVANLKRIVDSLKSGTVVPDEIIVFSNRDDLKIGDLGVPIVYSQKNLHCLARYALSLSFGADYCLFLDDDICVGKKTVERLFNQAEISPKAILGFEGRNLGKDKEKPYFSGSDVMGITDCPRPVAVVKGRLVFCKTERIASAICHLYRIGGLFFDGIVEEDILLSLTNKLDGYANFVLEAVGEEKTIDLPNGGVGYYSGDKDHYFRRDQTCKKIGDYGL